MTAIAGATSAEPGAAPSVRAALPARRTEVAAVGATLVLGVVARIVLLHSALGSINSDEATTGIQGMELWRGRAWVFVPGNVYGGNLDAWFNAPFEGLLPASPLRIKALAGLVWLVVAAIVYVALRRRVGPAPALAAAGVIWVPSAALVQLSTDAYPGYGFGLLTSVAVIVLALRLLESPPPAPGWVPLALGLMAGLAVWQHPLFVWVALPFTAVTAWHVRRSVRTVAAIVGGGVVALALPLLHNVRNDFPSINEVPVQPPTSYSGRVHDWLTDLLPRAIGGRWLDDGWVLGGVGQVMSVGALGVVMVLTVLALAKGSSHARVAAITALAAPLGLPLFEGAWYTHDARYAVMALPPLAFAVGYGVSRLPRLRDDLGLVAGALGVWCLVAVAAPFAIKLDDQPTDLSTERLAHVLREHHVTRVRSDYWVAYQLTYETDEAIVASPIEAVRFGHYENLVRAAEAQGTAALVLFDNEMPAFLAGGAPFDRVQSFRSAPQVRIGPWVVFLPSAPAGGR